VLFRSTNTPTNTPTAAYTPIYTPTNAPTSTPIPTEIIEPTLNLQNVALGKRAISDSQYYDNSSSSFYYFANPFNFFAAFNPLTRNDISFPATYAVDGDMSTRWCAANDGIGHYLEVDLGGFTYIKKRKFIEKAVGAASKYRIDVSIKFHKLGIKGR
jgi:hypothetical protein